jgi:hypothetical protein
MEAMLEALKIKLLASITPENETTSRTVSLMQNIEDLKVSKYSYCSAIATDNCQLDDRQLICMCSVLQLLALQPAWLCSCT